MNQTLIEFEQRTGLGPTFAARLLGVAYPTYAHYRSGHRDLPTYHARHVAHLLLHSPHMLKVIIKEDAYVGN